MSKKFNSVAKLTPPTMTLEKQKQYLCKQKRSIALIVFIVFMLSVIYFIWEINYCQSVMDTLNSIVNDGIAKYEQEAAVVSTPILSSVDRSIAWKYLFILFVILVLCVGLLLSAFLTHWNVRHLVSFRFNSNQTYIHCVKKDGAELIQNGVCVKVFDLTKDKLFFENFGMLLVYSTDTETFKVFTDTEFDSVTLRKNDGNSLGSLMVVGGEWQFL